jgi:hypothetical protein
MVYLGEMNELMDLHYRKWNLFILPSHKPDFIFGAIAHVAKNNIVTVLDCGRQYDATAVARKAGGRKDVTDRIKTQRAFTCPGVLALLEQASNQSQPVFILDFLSTFHDENIRLSTRKYLLEKSIQAFREISLVTRLFVTTSCPSSSNETFPLYKRLVLSSPQTFAYKVHTPIPHSSELF